MMRSTDLLGCLRKSRFPSDIWNLERKCHKNTPSHIVEVLMYTNTKVRRFKSKKKGYIRNKLVYTYLKENNMLREMRKYPEICYSKSVEEVKGYVNKRTKCDAIPVREEVPSKSVATPIREEEPSKSVATPIREEVPSKSDATPVIDPSVSPIESREDNHSSKSRDGCDEADSEGVL